MGSIFVMSVGLRRVLLLSLVLVVLFGWAPVAQAQTPADVQYGSPTGDPPAAATGASSGGGSGAGGGDGGAGVEVALLPTTGGPLLLPLIGLGAVALGATGVFALRRFGR